MTLAEASLPEERFFYDANDPVPFDSTKVLPFRVNPKAADFDEGSEERNAIDNFNRAYTRMLKLLHEAFNTPEDRDDEASGKLDEAINEMMEMQFAAGDLQDLKLGPTFEYLA